jgi:hypothetical protein
MANFLKYADQNGIAVMIDLFDENFMKNAADGSAPNWTRNPWNPSNNNITSAPKSCHKLDSLGNGLPNFYDILNTDGKTLNCLGQIEQNYVLSVVNFVRNTKACGNPGSPVRCKNVIFEAMNEARYDGAWGFPKASFQAWHNKVANWVHTRGGYMVAGNTKGVPGGTYGQPCSSGSYDDSCILKKCVYNSTTPPTVTCSDYTSGSTTWPNYLQAFSTFTDATAPRQDGVDIVTFHAWTWLEGTLGSQGVGDICTTQCSNPPCSRDAEALVFHKPVIFDDDGDGSGASDKALSYLQKWAQQVSGGTNSCGQSKGKLHLYHTKDGTTIEGTTTKKPSACSFRDGSKLDCFAWNALADGITEKLCGTTSGLTNCVSRITYCESPPNTLSNTGCETLNDTAGSQE